MELDQRRLISMYQRMYTIRVFDQTAVDEFHAGTIPGAVHSYVGQEAVAVGVCFALRQDDMIVSTHRGHGHTIAKGADIRRMMAELLGKTAGYCKGKGGSMHIADFSIGMLGANGIVGAGLPIATGAALAAQMEGSDRVSVAFFGDGASNEGAFHEALNLASVWKLPVIFVCENNLWASSVSSTETVSVQDISDRAASYDIPGVTVDGNDVLSVHEAACAAVERARLGLGPTLLECKTYRWHVHNAQRGPVADPRPPEEIEAWKRRDPIAAFGAYLLETGSTDGEVLEHLHLQVHERVAHALSWAKVSPSPQPEDALQDVFAS